MEAAHGPFDVALGVYSFKAEHWADVTARSAKLLALMVPPYGG